MAKIIGLVILIVFLVALTLGVLIYVYVEPGMLNSGGGEVTTRQPDQPDAVLPSDQTVPLNEPPIEPVTPEDAANPNFNPAEANNIPAGVPPDEVLLEPELPEGWPADALEPQIPRF